MDPEFSKWLATLGVGGVLAWFMFLIYRKDIKQFTELWQGVTAQLMIVIKENTASISKLISLIETQEKNTMRRSDFEQLVDKRIKGAEK